MMKKLQDIVGNEHAKRAIEVALSGEHDIVFIVMPDSPVELIEATKRLAFENDIKINCIGIKPCPCGSFGDWKNECNCSNAKINNHAKKIYPILKKHGIVVEIIAPRDTETAKNNESEDDIVGRAKKVRVQIGIGRACDIDSMAQEYLKRATEIALNEKYLVELATTICHMEGQTKIQPRHVAEAFQYRNHGLIGVMANMVD